MSIDFRSFLCESLIFNQLISDCHLVENLTVSFFNKLMPHLIMIDIYDDSSLSL